MKKVEIAKIVTVFFCYVAAVGIGPSGTGSAKTAIVSASHTRLRTAIVRLFTAMWLR